MKSKNNRILNIVLTALLLCSTSEKITAEYTSQITPWHYALGADFIILAALLGNQLIWNYQQAPFQTIPTDEYSQKIPTQTEKMDFLHQGLENNTLSWQDWCSIDALTSQWCYGKLTILITQTQKIAQERNHTISISEFNEIFYSMQYGMQVKHNSLKYWDIVCTEWLDGHTTWSKAVHEAGHAVSFIYNDCLQIVHHGTIGARPNYLGFIHHISSVPAGTFLTQEQVENFIMGFLAGGVAEQVCNVAYGYTPEMLIDAKKILEFCSRSIMHGDVLEARNFAHHIVTYYDQLMLTEKITYTHIELQQKIDEIIVRLYKKTYEFLTNHKEQVEKIARLLLDKETVSGDEMYATLEITRPLHHFEMQ